MNINLDLYNYFYYVCEFKSITKAASFLYVSQPAITKQIKNLENLLGKNLIIRSSKGIELTEDGVFLYNEIKNSIEKLNATEASFKENCDKYNIVLRIEAGHSTLKKFLLNALIEFNKIHPGIKFKVCVHPYPESMQLLKEGKIDLKFLSMEKYYEKNSDIVVEKFMEVDDIFVISKEMQKGFPKKIKLLDLNNYPTVVLTEDMISRNFIDDYYKKFDLQFKPKFELSSTWLIEEYVSLNSGIGVLVKQHILDKLKSGELVEIETDVTLPKRTMAYAYRKTSLKYPVIKEFIDYLKKYN